MPIRYYKLFYREKQKRMNKEEILYEIEKTKHHLTNLKKMLGEHNKRWKPKPSEEYYCVDDGNDVRRVIFNIVDIYDRDRIKTYNCFPTREQAEQEAEKILIRRQLEDISRRLNKGKEIDWDNREQLKHCIELYGNDIITNFYFAHKTQGAVYCLDTNFLDVAKREIGEERLKNYLRG